MAQVLNLSPFSVSVDAPLAQAFDDFGAAIDAAAGAGQAFLDVAIASGISLPFMSRPSAEASPEHRHGYALWSRLCIRKAAMMLGVSESAFEPVYSGAVKALDAVLIGGESKTVTAWKGYVSNAGRPIKTAMQRLVSDQAADAKAELTYAETARAEAKANGEKAEAAFNSANAIYLKAQADAEKAEAEAEAAPRGAKAAAKAKAAKLQAKARSLESEVAALREAADDVADIEVALIAEVKAARDTLEGLQALLPSTARGAGTVKTDAEKWAARVDALLKDVRGVTSPTGEVDAVGLVAALVAARGCIAGVIAE